VIKQSENTGVVKALILVPSIMGCVGKEALILILIKLYELFQGL
jgi:hypothetical protein